MDGLFNVVRTPQTDDFAFPAREPSTSSHSSTSSCMSPPPEWAPYSPPASYRPEPPPKVTARDLYIFSSRRSAMPSDAMPPRAARLQDAL
ncbi:hypothetical protein KFE25_010746 [Diacronema lutheri]|mgnify:CR=1 FL=1|uniref:Uncharacterized protein n=1 Tax=Diacronema lutheri TaxID=2081491 RepID=A0A8J5XDZ4_DIALT|nr:hypothetical protein KFE25_010746 [Diacronema lutheri]